MCQWGTNTWSFINFVSGDCLLEFFVCRRLRDSAECMLCRDQAQRVLDPPELTAGRFFVNDFWI